jgi:hypothetical protein
MVREAYPALEVDAAQQRRVGAALTEGWETGAIGNTRQAARLLVELWDLHRHAAGTTAGAVSR